MGKVATIIVDKVISLNPDRNANRIYIYRKPNNEVSIHFRNLKMTLLKEEEVEEFKIGFKEALKEFKKGNYLKNDV